MVITCCFNYVHHDGECRRSRGVDEQTQRFNMIHHNKQRGFEVRDGKNFTSKDERMVKDVT